MDVGYLREPFRFIDRGYAGGGGERATKLGVEVGMGPSRVVGGRSARYMLELFAVLDCNRLVYDAPALAGDYFPRSCVFSLR